MKNHLIVFSLLTSSFAFASTVEFESKQGSIATRYRFEQSTSGSTKVNDIQYAASWGFAVHGFDKKIELGALIGSGKSFTSGFLNTGVGHFKSEFVLDVRRAHLGYKPIDGLKISLGAMVPLDGVGSERTYLDNDGWVDGFRAEYAFSNFETHATVGSIPNNMPQAQKVGFYRRLSNYDDFSFRQIGTNIKFDSDFKGTIEYIYNLEKNHIRGAVKWFPEAGFLGAKNSGLLAEHTFQFRHHGKDTSATSAKMTRQWTFLERAVDTSVIWTYLHPSFSLPVADKVFANQSIWAHISSPKAIQAFGQDFELFAYYIQNLTYTQQRRVEGGISYKF